MLCVLCVARACVRGRVCGWALACPLRGVHLPGLCVGEWRPSPDPCLGLKYNVAQFYCTLLSVAQGEMFSGLIQTAFQAVVRTSGNILFVKVVNLFEFKVASQPATGVNILSIFHWIQIDQSLRVGVVADWLFFFWSVEMTPGVGQLLSSSEIL